MLFLDFFIVFPSSLIFLFVCSLYSSIIVPRYLIPFTYFSIFPLIILCFPFFFCYFYPSGCFFCVGNQYFIIYEFKFLEIHWLFLEFPTFIFLHLPFRSLWHPVMLWKTAVDLKRTLFSSRYSLWIPSHLNFAFSLCFCYLCKAFYIFRSFLFLFLFTLFNIPLIFYLLEAFSRSMKQICIYLPLCVSFFLIV